MAKLAERVRQAVRVLAEKTPWYSSASSAWMIPTSYNTRDYLKTYGEIGWLFGCVSRIGQAVADAELKLRVRRSADEVEHLYEHPMLDVLDYCNPFQTGYEFRMLTQFYLDLVGNSFWYVVKNRLGTPVELWVVPPQYMHPVPDRKTFMAGWIFRTGQEEIPFELNEIIHLSYPNPDNAYWGISPAQSIAVDLQTEAFAGRWNRNYFYNDAAIGTVLSYPEEISPDEYERIKEQWATNHRGVGRAHRMAVISGGAQLEKAVISQRDMDFHKLRHLNRDNILGAYGMPLSVMGVSENVNRANAESGEYVFSRWTVKPRLTLIAAKLTEQLAPLFDKKLEVMFVDPVPQNKEQNRKEREGALNAGYMTINEARQMADMTEIDGGDVLLFPNNKVPIRLENGKLVDLPTPRLANSGTPAEGETFSIKAKSNGHKLLGTEEERDAFWSRYVAKAEAEEKDIIGELKDMFQGQRKEALGNLTLSGGKNQKLIDQGKAKETFTDAVTEQLTELVSSAYEDALELVAPKTPHKMVKPTGSLKEAIDSYIWRAEGDPVPFEEAMEWLKTRIGWAAVEIGEETAKLLADQLAAGFAEGEGIPELAKRVDTVFDGATKNRTVMIARTETIMASNEGALKGYEAAEVEEAEFFAAMDERTCPECNGLHGDVFSLKDAHGMIPIHPQCRCVWLPAVGG